MKRYAWAVLLVGLGLEVVGTGMLAGQGGPPPPPPPPPVELKQNYPNPFNPATTIPFALSADLWANGHRPKVTLRIYNVLAQPVAVPILQGTGQDLRDLELTCASPVGGMCRFTAYWDGKVQTEGGAPGPEAASGVYIYQLTVDGRRFTKKMIVMK